MEQTKGQGPVGVVTMKLVLASKNKKKLAEMNDILSHLGVEVCSEAEAGVDVEVAKKKKKGLFSRFKKEKN